MQKIPSNVYLNVCNHGVNSLVSQRISLAARSGTYTYVSLQNQIHIFLNTNCRSYIMHTNPRIDHVIDQVTFSVHQLHIISAYVHSTSKLAVLNTTNSEIIIKVF
jgi:hypothetical protein